MTECYEQLNAKELDNLDAVDRFLERQSIEKENKTKQKSKKPQKNKKLPTMKILGADVSIDELYQIYKE